MAKVVTFIIYILLVLFLNSYNLSEISITGKEKSNAELGREDIPVTVDTTFADTVSVVIDTIPVVSDIPKYLVLQQVYTSQIGVREKTGNNDGPEVKKYMATVGLGEGYAWCAGFVKWCFLEAGYTNVSRMNGMALSTENKSDLIWKPSLKVDKRKTIRPGDVLTLYYTSLKRIGHTGFWDRDVNSTIYESVEGNTNDAAVREGDGVYRKKRSYNATYSISRW